MSKHLPYAIAIFDLDGTIGDTLPLIYEAFDAALRPKLNRRLPDHEVRAMFGPPDNAIIRSLISGEEGELAVERYTDVYQRDHDRLATLFPGIEATLEAARQQGMRLALVTGKSRVTALHSLKAFGVLDNFDAIYAGDDVERQKPDPEALLRAMRDLGRRDEENAVIIGDSAADVLAGRAASIATIGVTWGNPDHDELYESRPDLIVHSVPELAEALGLDSPSLVPATDTLSEPE